MWKYTFYIGTDMTEFNIHAGNIVRVSVPLANLMTESWKDTGEPSIWLSEIDEQIFAMFREFVYTGNYKVVASENGRPRNERTMS